MSHILAKREDYSHSDRKILILLLLLLLTSWIYFLFPKNLFCTTSDVSQIEKVEIPVVPSNELDEKNTKVTSEIKPVAIYGNNIELINIETPRQNEKVEFLYNGTDEYVEIEWLVDDRIEMKSVEYGEVFSYRFSQPGRYFIKVINPEANRIDTLLVEVLAANSTNGPKMQPNYQEGYPADVVRQNEYEHPTVSNTEVDYADIASEKTNSASEYTVEKGSQSHGALVPKETEYPLSIPTDKTPNNNGESNQMELMNVEERLMEASKKEVEEEVVEKEPDRLSRDIKKTIDEVNPSEASSSEVNTSEEHLDLEEFDEEEIVSNQAEDVQVSKNVETVSKDDKTDVKEKFRKLDLLSLEDLLMMVARRGNEEQSSELEEGALFAREELKYYISSTSIPVRRKIEIDGKEEFLGSSQALNHFLDDLYLRKNLLENIISQIQVADISYGTDGKILGFSYIIHK